MNFDFGLKAAWRLVLECGRSHWIIQFHDDSMWTILQNGCIIPYELESSDIFGHAGTKESMEMLDLLAQEKA